MLPATTLYVNPFHNHNHNHHNCIKLTNSQLFLSDPEAKFSKSIGWADAEGRTYRYALVIDHGKVTYAAKEAEKNVLEVTSADHVYKQL